jgi:c-di-GMP-binding flagellar brake protein YcgR
MTPPPDTPASDSDIESPVSALPDLQLVIGTVLNLQNLSDKSGARLQVRVLGYLEGHSIIATPPGAFLLPADLRLGDEVTVRYLIGRSVCGFKTHVVRVCTSPYPYFHLAYPDQVQKMDVRQAERAQVSLGAQAQGSRGEAAVELRDLSAGGALVLATTELGNVGDALKLSFELTFGDLTRQISTGATIRSATPLQRQDDSETVFRFGVQFQDLDEGDRIFVRGFVFEQIASHGSAAMVLASPATAAA